MVDREVEVVSSHRGSFVPMKHVFITGASSGIGRAAAHRLHREGCALTLFARTTEKLESLAAELGQNVLIQHGDIRDYTAVKAAMDLSVAHFGKLDVLINNAGLGFFAPLTAGQIDHWNEMVDTNIKGVLNAWHAALPYLLAANGHVINIGSVASHLVFPNSGIYCATKHAVLAISESMRMELSGQLAVTTISPGSVNTPFIENTPDEQLLQDLRPGFADGLAPETIAEHIAFAIGQSGKSVVSEIIVRPDKRKF